MREKDLKQNTKPVRHEKGWGHELWIVNNNLYCGKILHFNKGKKCSWHYHKIKQETFYVQKGKLKIWYGYDDDITNAKELIMTPGQKFELPSWIETSNIRFRRYRYV